MVALNKEQVQQTIIKIANMEGLELRKFAQATSMSDVDDKARSFINRAIDLRYAQLCDINVSGLMVEMGDCNFDFE